MKNLTICTCAELRSSCLFVEASFEGRPKFANDKDYLLDGSGVMATWCNAVMRRKSKTVKRCAATSVGLSCLARYGAPEQVERSDSA